MTKRPAPNLTTLMSPLQNNKMRMCTNNNNILSPQINEKNSVFSHKPTFKSARTTLEPRNMGYFLRIKVSLKEEVITCYRKEEHLRIKQVELSHRTVSRLSRDYYSYINPDLI